MKRKSDSEGPQTDDELWTWIKNNLGMEIPRVAVCDGHTAPFQFIADIYFERVTSAIAMANRGGSKTMSSAIIHLLNSIFKPRCESLSIGAQLAQAQRVYDNLKMLLKLHGDVDDVEKHPLVEKSIQEKTILRNGSTMSIVPGTISAVNGPHDSKVHTDEAEIMDYAVFLESRNISQSKSHSYKDPNTGELKTIEIKAQDWITSTRKSSNGLMQKMLDEIDEALANGNEPAYKLYVWCFAEASKNQPSCRVAFPDLPEDQKCNCDRVVKDTWEDGSPRRFSDVCNGRLARSQGFLPLEDTHKRFMANDQATWEAQQECSKPEIGGMVFKVFNKKRHGIKWWEPNPELGDIVQGVDFSGGTNPAAVLWFQVLNQDIEWWSADQVRDDKPNKLLKAGTRIAFDEIYKANLGNAELADLVKLKENYWKNRYPEFKVGYRFVDPANRGSREDWYYAYNLKTQFFATRSIPEQVRTCNTLLKEDKFVYDLTRCEMFPLEMEAYHYPQNRMGKEYDPEIPVDDYNHTVSAFRYAMENLKVLEQRGTEVTTKPKAGNQIHYTAKTATKSSTPRYVPRFM